MTPRLAELARTPREAALDAFFAAARAERSARSRIAALVRERRAAGDALRDLEHAHGALTAARELAARIAPGTDDEDAQVG